MNEPNGQNDVESRGSITLNMNRNGKYQTSLNYTVGGQQKKETAEKILEQDEGYVYILILDVK